MEPKRSADWLRLEKIRVGLQYTVFEAELAKALYLQSMAALLTAAVATLASLLFHRIPWALGAGLTCILFLGVLVLGLRLLRVRIRVRRSTEAAMVGIDALIRGQEG